MKTEHFYRHLKVPNHKIDVVLDTDAYNEIDDQFAIAYLLRMPERANVVGLTAASFYAPDCNHKSVSAADGMEKSHEELKKILTLAGREDLIPHVYRGSEQFLPDEQTPVTSDAAAPERPMMRYVEYINRDALFADLVASLTAPTDKA